MSRIPHEWYLAHDLHFALAGASTIELSIDVETPAPTPLRICWEYWDGKVWRPFMAMRWHAHPDP